MGCSTLRNGSGRPIDSPSGRAPIRSRDCRWPSPWKPRRKPRRMSTATQRPRVGCRSPDSRCGTGASRGVDVSPLSPWSCSAQGPRNARYSSRMATASRTISPRVSCSCMPLGCRQTRNHCRTGTPRVIVPPPGTPLDRALGWLQRPPPQLRGTSAARRLSSRLLRSLQEVPGGAAEYRLPPRGAAGRCAGEAIARSRRSAASRAGHRRPPAIARHAGESAGGAVGCRHRPWWRARVPGVAAYRCPSASRSGGVPGVVRRLTGPAAAILYFEARNVRSRVAQLVEQVTVNHRVRGSSPLAGVT